MLVVGGTAGAAGADGVTASDGRLWLPQPWSVPADTTKRYDVDAVKPLTTAERMLAGTRRVTPGDWHSSCETRRYSKAPGARKLGLVLRTMKPGRIAVNEKVPPTVSAAVHDRGIWIHASFSRSL